MMFSSLCNAVLLYYVNTNTTGNLCQHLKIEPVPSLFLSLDYPVFMEEPLWGALYEKKVIFPAVSLR